jgi:predicted transcriptional regulator
MSRETRTRHREVSTVDLLADTGMSRNVAKALVFLAGREETTSVEIEKATGLRQPEVSIAMQDLRRRRWVEKRYIKKEGKGRPVHAYRLAVPFSAVVEAIARAERRKVERVQGIVRRLKRRAARP